MPIHLIDISEEYPELNNVYHLGYYIPKNTGMDDQLSREVINFKYNKRGAVQNWQELFFDMVDLSVLGPPDTYGFVRVLGHKELNASWESPLDHLIMHFSEAYYDPLIITKSRHTKKFSSLNKMERQQELLNVYQCVQQKSYDKCTYIIFDDIITTGSSLIAVSHAIQKTFPNAIIKCLALAKTSDPDPHVLRYNQQLYNCLTGKSQQISSPPTGGKDVGMLYEDYDDDDYDDASKWSESSTDSG